MAGKEQKKHRVAVIGSGNWGSAVAKIVAENTAARSDLFEEEVQMWVFEEKVELDADSRHYDRFNPLCTEPQPLTTLINNFHENVKYLPGALLPHNLIANPSLKETVKGATILVFNLPHQFISKTCNDLEGNILPFARGISCIKGVDVTRDQISLFSDMISERLGIYCGALSGANIASEVAQGKFSETTVAYEPPAGDSGAASSSGAKPAHSTIKLTPIPAEYRPVDHDLLHQLFHRPYFHVRLVNDVAAVSLAGALKNVVALAAGFVMGLGWGDNARAAIMRVGLLEMVRFGHTFFPNAGIRTETFTEESAGVADLITSCAAGRNYRCAKASVERGISIQQVEKEMLNGQILQGVGTANEVNAFLRARGKEKDFPLFTAVYQILHGEKQAKQLPQLLEGGEKKTPKL